MRPAAHHMQCLEVWGGNGAADAGVVMPGLDVWVFAKPHGQAGGTANSGEGGDVHYVSSCGTGRISRVLLADVAGHGPAVAMLARTLRDLMRRHVNTVNQAGFVGRMNSEFLAAAEEAGGRFATAVVATFWAPTGYLVACNAGHPRPMGYSSRSKQWRTVEGGVDVEAAGPSNLPLGIADDAQYTQFAVRLVAGDVVVLYTDALLECRLPDGRMLGEAGLLDCIRQLDASRPELLASGLYNAVASKCPNPPDDDATVLVLRCSGGPGQLRSHRVRSPVSGFSPWSPGRWLRAFGEGNRRPFPGRSSRWRTSAAGSSRPSGWDWGEMPVAWTSRSRWCDVDRATADRWLATLGACRRGSVAAGG